MTWSTSYGSAAVRVFSSIGRLLENTGVTKSHPQFRVTVAPGQYLILLKVTKGHLGSKNLIYTGCVRTAVQVQAHHTTHVQLGRKCSSSIG